MSNNADNQIRRTPQQARSRRQVNRMLDAAAAVFAEVGYDTATTNTIATRAGMSIGSLYQFFPNKAALFHALTTRYHAQLREVLDHVVTLDVAALPLDQLLDRIIDAFWEFAQEQRGFVQMLLSAKLSPELMAEEIALTREGVERIDAIMAARAPDLDPERRRLLATVSVDIVNALLHRSIITEPAFGAQVIAEAKTVLLAYLSLYGTHDPQPEAANTTHAR